MNYSFKDYVHVFCLTLPLCLLTCTVLSSLHYLALSPSFTLFIPPSSAFLCPSLLPSSFPYFSTISLLCHHPINARIMLSSFRSGIPLTTLWLLLTCQTGREANWLGILVYLPPTPACFVCFFVFFSPYGEIYYQYAVCPTLGSTGTIPHI